MTDFLNYGIFDIRQNIEGKWEPVEKVEYFSFTPSSHSIEYINTTQKFGLHINAKKYLILYLINLLLNIICL